MEREQLVAAVLAAKQGDQTAMNTLFNEYYNTVYYLALKTVKNEDLACDITQETFVEVIRTLKNLQEPAAFVTWIKTVAYHQCTRYFKKKRDVLVDEDEDGNTIFDTVEEDAAEFNPHEALDRDDFRRTILAILDELSEEQRSATILYYFDELSVKQIAEIQGVSEGTVKSRLNYARKAIKASVEAYEKKHNIKLHAIPFVPFFGWLFEGAFEGGMAAPAAQAVAQGVTTATGTAVSVGGAGATAGATAAAATTVGAATAKAAAVPLAAKIVAGVTAATIAVGGGTTAVVMLQDHVPSGGDTVITTTTIDTTTTAPTASLIDGELVLEGIIPDGCVYVTFGGDVLEAGEAFPDDCTAGDRVTYGDYLYSYESVSVDNGNSFLLWADRFDDGDSGMVDSDAFGCWSVAVRDTGKTSYGQIATRINKREVRTMLATFLGCDKMVEAPTIPSSVTAMVMTFEGCISLRTAPVIPKNVRRVMGAFSRCMSLTGDVVIHAELDTSLTYFYSTVFDGTRFPINLTGSTPEDKLWLLADYTNGNGHITVNGKSRPTTQTETETTTTPIVVAFRVPQGATYTAADGTVYAAGQTITTPPQFGDQLLTNDYEYRYGSTCDIVWDGGEDFEIVWKKHDTSFWAVRVRDTTKTEYEPLFDSINHAPLYDIDYAYAGCKNMTQAPQPPEGVGFMQYTYLYCTSMKQGPTLPSSLTTGCGTFYRCSALEAAPTLPSELVAMCNMFQGCTSLTVAPTIPSKANDLFAVFADCTALTTAPIIPSTVTELSVAFSGCTALRGEIVIHAQLTAEGVTDCFKDTVLSITLTGSSHSLQELAATANNGNITVA